MIAVLLACAPEAVVVETGDEGTPPETPWCASPGTFGYTPFPGIFDTTSDAADRGVVNPVALADFDGDGDDDFVLGDAERGLWYHPTGAEGFDAPAQLSPVTELATLALGDFDGDGDLDLVGAGLEPEVVVLAGDGAGGFTEVSASGLDGLAWVRDATPGDFDGDGDLDLFFATALEGHRLFRNLGGTFEDTTSLLPSTARAGLGWQGSWFDMELDGDLDLFVFNAEQSVHGPSRLVRNDGGTFTDITDACGCGWTGSNMGASEGDVSGDGLPDFFVTNTGPSPLLVNGGDGTFIDYAAAMGAGAVPESTWMTFSSALYDAENDGDLDVLTTTGPLHAGDPGPQVPVQADVFLLREGDGFVDRAHEYGLDDLGAGRGLASGLLDGDGFLDVVVNNRGTPSAAYRASCTAARALVLDLVGPAPNTFGMGARVVVETDAGTIVRTIGTRGGWAGASHPRAHFGLGERRVDAVTVHWLDGTVQDVEVPPYPDRRVTVEHP